MTDTEDRIILKTSPWVHWVGNVPYIRAESLLAILTEVRLQAEEIGWETKVLETLDRVAIDVVNKQPPQKP